MQLIPPPEPCSLKDRARTLLAEQPATGRKLLARGDWIAEPLWLLWGNQLQEVGITCQQLRLIAAGYQNEMRLWLVGERIWEHAIEGLIGRITRRIRSQTGIESEVGSMQHV